MKTASDLHGQTRIAAENNERVRIAGEAVDWDCNNAALAVMTGLTPKTVGHIVKRCGFTPKKQAKQAKVPVAKFWITARIGNRYHVQHKVKGGTVSEAWAAFQSKYPDRHCIRTDAKRAEA
jgi:hypothetical protein